MHTISISNLGNGVTHDSLAAVFSTYGYVHTSVMVAGTLPEEKRMAFVDMPNEQEACRAVEQLNGCIIDGHAVEVKKAAPGYWYP